MRHNVRFTQAEYALLIKYQRRKLSLLQIARKLNRNPSSIHGRLKLLEAGIAQPVKAEIVAEIGASTDTAIRQATHRLWIAVARAIANGDHVPAAQRLAA